MEYELLDRRKGERITPYFFGQIKHQLNRSSKYRKTHEQIAALYNVGVDTVRRINEVTNFLEYKELYA